MEKDNINNEKILIKELELELELVKKNLQDEINKASEQEKAYIKEQEKLNNEKRALRDELDSILYSRSYKFISKVKNNKEIKLWKTL